MALVAALLALDALTGAGVSLIPAFALGPLLAAVRCRPREVAIVGLAAMTAVLTAIVIVEDPNVRQQVVRIVTVAGASALAVWTAALRARSEDLAAREAFLSRTGELLAEAPADVHETLARVARAAVPTVADWCAIDLRTGGEGLDRAAVAHADPAKQRRAEELKRRWPGRLSDADGAGEVIRTGEPRLYAEIPDVSQWPPGTREAEHVQLLGELGLRSGMIVPLTVRGRTIGALTLMAAESGRRYDYGDLRFAWELARRCALAVDNGRLIQEARAAEARLSESFALIDSLFESAPIGLAHYDRELRYVRVNSRLAEINGRPAADHPGRTTAEIIPGMEGPVEAALREVLETGRPVTVEDMDGALPSAPGRTREFHVSYYPVRRGDEILGVGTVVFEITDRRAAERALRSQTDRYETLMLALSEVGEGMLVMEGDQLVYANPAFEQLTGYALDELRAMHSIWDLLPDWHRREAQIRTELRVEEGRVDPHYQLPVIHRTGRLVDLEVAGVPLAIDEREQLVVVVRDITARKRAEAQREEALTLERQARETAEAAERRTALLAEASALFDATLDEAETLERVARLTVREVADTCVVLLTGDGAGGSAGAHEAIAVARDPRVEAVMRELAPRWPAERTVAQVVRAGEAQLIRHFGRTLEAMAEDPEHAERIRGLDITAVALVPLRARGRTFGALACGFAAPPAPDHEHEVLSLLDDLARRAALAMDNARLYAERSHVARTLQRSLLPPALPRLPGVELAARYRPAGSGNEVGGDFYDCFATSRDEYALVIGDVCGKGAEAAAVTALARYTVRASVLHSESPVRVLSELNEAILRQELDHRFCTVLYAALAPAGDGWSARLASGGHPLPFLVRAGGGVEQPGRSGTLLGIVPDPDLEEQQVLLGPGDALVLYTDGVTEASPVDDRFGPEALAALLAGHAGAPAAQMADAVERAVLEIQDGRLRDDIAIVVLRVASGT